MRFSEQANRIFDNYRWQKLNLRSEFRSYAKADWYDDKGQYERSYNHKAHIELIYLGLITFDRDKQRYTRTALGKEISSIYS